MSSEEGPQNVTLGAIFWERWSRPPSPPPPLDWRLALGRIGTARLEHLADGACRRHAPIPPTADSPSPAVCLQVAGKLDPVWAWQATMSKLLLDIGAAGSSGEKGGVLLQQVLGLGAPPVRHRAGTGEHWPTPTCVRRAPRPPDCCPGPAPHAPPQTLPPRHHAAPASSPGRHRARGRPSVAPARPHDPFPSCRSA